MCILQGVTILQVEAMPTTDFLKSSSCITIGGCDKNMPGCVMAMARLNRPSIFIYGGSIRPGAGRTDIVSVFEAVGKYSQKKLMRKNYTK